MGTYTVIDIDRWKRRDQYHFFKNFETPWFNVTAPVDVTQLLKNSRENGHPFSLSSVFHALQCINEIDELRYRIQGDEVLDFKSINAGVTILQPDETFMYCTLQNDDHHDRFITDSKAAIAEQKRSRGFEPHIRLDMVFFSILPRVAFSGISHAMNQSPTIFIPRIVFGKYHEVNGRMEMPVSLQVHHALADGLHVSKFFEQFQQRIQ